MENFSIPTIQPILRMYIRAFNIILPSFGTTLHPTQVRTYVCVYVLVTKRQSEQGGVKKNARESLTNMRS